MTTLDTAKFEQLRARFEQDTASRPEVWAALQQLSADCIPAQLFIAIQRLKGSPPLFDPTAAVRMLRGVLERLAVGSGTTAAAVAKDFAGPVSAEIEYHRTALYWLGEAAACHGSDESWQQAGYFDYFRQAAALGHVEAQLQLAYCWRHGLGCERDLQQSRLNLRRAALRRHPRGAFELALQLLGGSAGEVERDAGLEWLSRAAASNYPAAASLLSRWQHAARVSDLPETMPTAAILHQQPLVKQFNAVLDPTECSHLAALAMLHLQPSRVISDTAGGKASSGRTSEGMNFHPGRRDLVVTHVVRRLCTLAGCRFSQAEALALLKYQPGAQYRVHPDYFPVDSVAGRRQLGNGGQRLKTWVCYLNTVAEGGATSFPDLNIEVAPVEGNALLFENAMRSGEPYPKARHAGNPVISGSKWIVTLWLRQLDYEQ